MTMGSMAERLSQPGSKAKRIPQSIVRIVLCNREHEVGIASDRGSACRGESVLYDNDGAAVLVKYI